MRYWASIHFWEGKALFGFERCRQCLDAPKQATLAGVVALRVPSLSQPVSGLSPGGDGRISALRGAACWGP